MAVIDHAGFREGAGAQFGVSDAFGGILDWLRSSIADDLWKWYAENPNRKIVTVRKWVFSFTVRVRHLEPLFELLFGPRPVVGRLG